MHPLPQASLVDSRAKALTAMVFVLSSYLMLALLCVSGQLPTFGNAASHSALEIVHLKVPTAAFNDLHDMRRPDRSDGQAIVDSRSHVPGFGANNPDITSISVVAAVAWADGYHPRATLRRADWDAARTAARRWYRTIVLLI